MTYFVVTDRDEDLSNLDGPAGHQLQHNSKRFGLLLVPVMWKPIDGGKGYECPACQMVHVVKTMHLHLDMQGCVVVSQAVYETLKKIGLDSLGFTKIGVILNPPPIAVHRPRDEVDNDNRAIRLLGNQIGRVSNG